MRKKRKRTILREKTREKKCSISSEKFQLHLSARADFFIPGVVRSHRNGKGKIQSGNTSQVVELSTNLNRAGEREREKKRIGTTQPYRHSLIRRPLRSKIQLRRIIRCVVAFALSLPPPLALSLSLSCFIQ